MAVELCGDEPRPAGDHPGSRGPGASSASWVQHPEVTLRSLLRASLKPPTLFHTLFSAAALVLSSKRGRPASPRRPGRHLVSSCSRTPDVIVVNAPGVLVGVGEGTSHGSPHPYDRDVPLVFHGPGFEAERAQGCCGSPDGVPALLRAAELETDALFDGRALQG